MHRGCFSTQIQHWIYSLRYNNIYAVSPKGQLELSGAVTSISALEVDLLVRFDGVLTLAQIRQAMDASAIDAFDNTLATLLIKGLAVPAPPDPFSASLSFQFNTSALTQSGAEADACAASLKKSNYYVRIARKRGVPRARAERERLSAIIVDDEPQLAKFLSHLLTFEGFDVRVAGSRAEVVAELRKTPIPDLVLLDVMLPDADGFDILLRIRAHPVLKEIPVIMLTAKSSREAVLMGLAGGADGYVTKPVEPDAVLQAVRTVMGFKAE
jgi:two-component system, OmpR family, response regulator